MKCNAASPGVSIEIRPPRKHDPARLRTGDRQGQSLLEFAVCLPILLLIVTGICTFGMALNNYLSLTNAVSVGGRLLAISRGQTTDPCATTASAVYGAAPLLSQSALSFTLVLNGTPYSGASCSSTSTTTGAAGNLQQGTTATVTVSYPCNLSVYGVNYLPTCSLTSQIAELVQ